MLEKMIYNYEEKDFFNFHASRSDSYDFSPSYADEAKRLIAKVIKHLLTDTIGIFNAAHFIFDDGESWCVTYETDDFRKENNLLTVTVSYGPYSKDEPYKIDAATLRRKLYRAVPKQEAA